MCGIAGIIHRDGAENVGQEMTAMLQSLKHRGPDSTGYAVYGTAGQNEYVMRFKVAEGEDMSRGFDIHNEVKKRRATVDERLASLGVQIIERKEATEYASRYRIQYQGDMKKLADYVEDVEGVEILSIGNALELIKDLGDASCVAGQYGLHHFQGTHGIGHTRMATESDVDIRSAHPYWAYPYNDIAVVHNGQLTNYWAMRREFERKGHRFVSDCDSELLAVYTAYNLEHGATLEESLKAVDRRDRRRVHLSGFDQGRAWHGQGQHGGKADGAVRKRKSRGACFGRSGHPNCYQSGDRNP